MKKMLLSMVVAFMAFNLNAQTTSFASLTAEDFTNLSGCKMSTYEMDKVEGPSVNYIAESNTVMTVDVKGITFSYKNSSTKDNILKTGPEFLQTDGKNVTMTLKNVPVGDVITINVTAKGSTAAVFGVIGATAASSNPSTISKSDTYTDLKFTATASTVEISETGGGYRIKSVTIGDDDGGEITPEGTVIYDASSAYQNMTPTVFEGVVTVTNTAVSGGGGEADLQLTTVTGDTEATAVFPNNLSFSFTNSNSDKKYMKIASGQIRNEGKDLIMIISGLTVGETISFTDLGGSGAECDATGLSDGASVTIAAGTTSTFTISASTVTLKVMGDKKYRIIKIETSGSISSINDIPADLGDVVAVEVYALSGVKVAEAASLDAVQLEKGIYIVKSIYEGGKSAVSKIAK